MSCSSMSLASASNTTHSISSPQANLSSNFYDTQVEVFMAITEMKRSFYIDNKGNLASRSIDPQQIVLYWKPPGTGDWVEKCRTEVLEGRTNLQFARKGDLNFDTVDKSGIQLRFVVGDWSCIDVTLEQLLKSGSRGDHIPLALKLKSVSAGGISPRVQKCMDNTAPGTLFVRVEILKPAERQCRILCESSQNYFFEVSKINQEGHRDIPNAFTLLSRSEARPTGVLFTQMYFDESKIFNGNYERELKFDVYKRKSLANKGFALTNLVSFVKGPNDHINRLIELTLDQTRIKTKRIINMDLKIGRQTQLHHLEYYFQRGLKVSRVYAVDFSQLNWDSNLHRRGVHNPGGFATYEETLKVVANASKNFTHCQSLYSFGDDRATFESKIPTDCDIKSLLNAYEQAAYGFRVTHMRSQNDLSVPAPSYWTSPYKSSAIRDKTQLAPLLGEISKLVSKRYAPLPNSFNIQYYTIFIFTNGEICDVELSKKFLAKLSALPVSIVFIGVGHGDFKALLELESCEYTFTSEERKFVNVIHFRNFNHWTNALFNFGFKSDPMHILTKEILTPVRKEMLHFVRTNLPCT